MLPQGEAGVGIIRCQSSTGKLQYSRLPESLSSYMYAKQKCHLHFIFSTKLSLTSFVKLYSNLCNLYQRKEHSWQRVRHSTVPLLQLWKFYSTKVRLSLVNEKYLWRHIDQYCNSCLVLNNISNTRQCFIRISKHLPRTELKIWHAALVFLMKFEVFG